MAPHSVVIAIWSAAGADLVNGAAAAAVAGATIGRFPAAAGVAAAEAGPIVRSAESSTLC